MCPAVDDLTVIDMGDHDQFFQTLSEVRRRGDPFWWLYASRCSECGQVWLIAQEERQNDIFILRRLDQETSEALINNDVWPSDFDRYERLLQIGRDARREVRFADPFDSSLLFTIKDLASERPGIRVSEIATLLNLDHRLATKLAEKVKGQMQVVITFD